MVYINFPTTIKGITFQKDFLINDLHTLKLDMFVLFELVRLLSIRFFITYHHVTLSLTLRNSTKLLDISWFLRFFDLKQDNLRKMVSISTKCFITEAFTIYHIAQISWEITCLVFLLCICFSGTSINLFLFMSLSDSLYWMTLVIIEDAFYSSSIEYNLMKEENYNCMWLKRISNKK